MRLTCDLDNSRKQHLDHRTPLKSFHEFAGKPVPRLTLVQRAWSFVPLILKFDSFKTAVIRG